MYTLIVVDYNGMDATLAHITRCEKSLGIRHVVLVQNGSNDGVEEKLRAVYGAPETKTLPEISQPLLCFHTPTLDICYCHSGENMGYARGNNLGATIAKELWQDFGYLISNNDLDFEQPFDIRVLDEIFASHPEVGLVGPGVITPQGNRQSPQAWAPAGRRLIVDYWRRILASFMTSSKKDAYLSTHCNDLVENAPEGPCAWVSGCFFFVTAEAFHKAGMFDPHTFLYAEEMILSRRLEQVGYTVWYCPRLEVVHKHGQTTKNSLSVFRVREIDFHAVHYYYETYTSTPRWLLHLAKWNFAFYKAYFHFTHKLMQLLRRGHE